MSDHAKHILKRAVLESLEGRQLFASVSLSSVGVLTLQGDAATPNELIVSLNPGGNLVTSVNGQTRVVPASAVKSIRLIGGSAADTLKATSGVVAPVYAFGGAGDDSLTGAGGSDTLVGGAGNDVLAGGGGVNVLDGGEGTNTLDGVPAGTKLAGSGVGTTGSWNNTSNTLDKAIDGNPSTFFDSHVSNNAWVGLDLGQQKVLTSIRFYPREGLAWRMTGGKFQASNDGANWTELATIAAEPSEKTYTTITLSGTDAFRYVRYVAPAGGYGNIAEIEFYGNSRATPAPVVPAPLAPTGLAATGMTTSAVTLAWTAAGSNESGFRVERSTDGGTTYATIGSVAARTTTFTDSTASPSTAYTYRVVAFNTGGASGPSALLTVTTPSLPAPVVTPGSGKLNGSGFGTAGSWNGGNATFDKSIDGNLATYFDSSLNTGAVVGLDLGEAKVITSVRYAPRTGLGWRMVGGTFQGSNDQTNWTTLATVTTAPSDGQYASLSVTEAAAFRYVRYVSPAGGWGNIAEAEFYGQAPQVGESDGSTNAPGGIADPTPQPVPDTTPDPTPEPTPDPTPVPVTDAPQAVITLLKSSVTAGMTVHANAVTSTMLKTGTPLTARYEWDFGDPAGKYNTLTGFNAGHVYDTAGTYTITLKVTDEAGKSSTVTSQVTVTGDTRKTIYVDALAGLDANAGTSEDAPVQSIARAMKLAANDTRVLLMRGQTFAVATSIIIGGSNLTIGAYGAGTDRPVMSWVGGTEGWQEMITLTPSTKDFMLQDVALDSGNAGRPNGIAPRGTNVSMRNVEMRRLSTAINCAGNPTGLLVQDCIQPTDGSVTAYFLWLQGNDSVILGNSIADGGMYAIRSSGINGVTNRSLIAYNQMNHVTGSTNLRLQKGTYYYVANNTFRGKGIDFGPNGGGLGFEDPEYKTVRTSWVVMENNVAYFGTGLGENHLKISHRAEHVMIRNNAFYRDGDGATFEINGYYADYAAQSYDIYIQNNTVVNNGLTGSFLRMDQAELTPEVTVKGNLYVAPNQITGAPGGILTINDPALTSFKYIGGNIWDSTLTDGYAAGGVIYIQPMITGGTGLLTPAQWELLPMVHDDLFADPVLVGTYQLTIRGTTAGSNLPL